MIRLVLVSLLAIPISHSVSAADLELSAIFSDHMVLQRDQPIRVWGWADAGAEVRCVLGDQTATATAGDDGKWSLELKPMKAGGPHTLTVTRGDAVVRISDVYVGEVWLCSGQSNMAMTVSRSLNFEEEAANADLPLIRMFKESSSHSTEPQEKASGTWTVCSPDTVGGFTATGFFFGRRLHKNLNVPIGLINSSVGGTSIESWTSMPAQQANDAVQPAVQWWQQQDDAFDPDAAKAQYESALARWEKQRDAARDAGKAIPRKPQLAAQPSRDRNAPSNLFNGKIHPLVGYGIRGAIWYQGERNSNTEYSNIYGQQLETLIGDWRARWGQGDFPFAWAQLPNYKTLQTEPSEPSGWVDVREGMLHTLKVPNTGMAVTVDVGEANDIHPKNKQAVGARLARWALAEVYGRAEKLPHGPEAMGPIFESAERDGRKMMIRFQCAGEQLPEPEGGIKGFAVAGADHKFHWAKAKVVGNSVEVWSDDVPEPAAVRYAWAANPIGNLFNSSEVPASPFRTDNWSE